MPCLLYARKNKDSKADVSRILFVAPLLLFASSAAPGQDFQELQRKTTDFVLPNGMRFVVSERRAAPSISVRVYVRAGAANDPQGAFGLASMFERMLLAGTEVIGTHDAGAEKKALDGAEEVRDRLDAETAKGERAGEGKVASLRIELSRAAGQAAALGDPGELTGLLGRNLVTWAIHTGADSTILEATVPSDRAELWFLTQSQEFHRPVFRHFYEEREDAASTYRARVDAVPLNNLLRTLAAAAFSAHPYRNPVAGWPADLAALRLNDARQFFNRYYAPGNITVAIAGDITAEDAKRLAERYFAPIPARPLPPPVRTEEPEQKGPRTVVLENSAQSMLAVGYKRPDESDRADLPLEVIRMILAGGATGWLDQDLVQQRLVATSVQAQASYPGVLYPHLFVIVANVAPGHTPAEVEERITAAIARLQNEKLEPATIERARSMARAALLRYAADNAGIAGLLARTAGELGDWRKLFSIYEDLGKVTPEQVQLAAIRYLTPSRRTSVHMNPPAAAVLPAQGASR